MISLNRRASHTPSHPIEALACDRENGDHPRCQVSPPATSNTNMERHLTTVDTTTKFLSLLSTPLPSAMGRSILPWAWPRQSSNIPRAWPGQHSRQACALALSNYPTINKILGETPTYYPPTLWQRLMIEKQSNSQHQQVGILILCQLLNNQIRITTTKNQKKISTTQTTTTTTTTT